MGELILLAVGVVVGVVFEKSLVVYKNKAIKAVKAAADTIKQ